MMTSFLFLLLTDFLLPTGGDANLDSSIEDTLSQLLIFQVGC